MNETVPQGAIFKKDGQQNTPAAAPVQEENTKQKEDFIDPFEQQSQTIQDRAKSQKRVIPDQSEAAAQATANALNQENKANAELEEEFNEMQKISDQDMELAEQLIFKGYAELEVTMPNLPKFKFTICSTSAEEMGMIDEILYEMVKKEEDKETGKVDMPQNKLSAMRNALLIAMSYRGMNEVELMKDNTLCHLNSIKKAIIQLSMLEDAGELDRAKKMKADIMANLTRRANMVKRLPTPTIDFLSGEKYRFDDKMISILNAKKILPKL